MARITGNKKIPEPRILKAFAVIPGFSYCKLEKGLEPV